MLPKSYTTFDLNGYTPSHITLNVKNPQEFYEKAVIWKRLKHDNILPIQRFDINTNQAVNIASDRVYDLPRYIGRRERTEEFPAIVGIRFVGFILCSPSPPAIPWRVEGSPRSIPSCACRCPSCFAHPRLTLADSYTMSQGDSATSTHGM